MEGASGSWVVEWQSFFVEAIWYFQLPCYFWISQVWGDQSLLPNYGSLYQCRLKRTRYCHSYNEIPFLLLITNATRSLRKFWPGLSGRVQAGVAMLLNGCRANPNQGQQTSCSNSAVSGQNLFKFRTHDPWMSLSVSQKFGGKMSKTFGSSSEFVQPTQNEQGGRGSNNENAVISVYFITFC